MEINKGIELFNDHDFFEAHDFFEKLWIECRGEEKLFLQGMVQVSVGCYHLICGNYKGSASQLVKGSEKLKNYLPEYYNVDLEKLIIDINFLLNLLNENKKIKIGNDHIPKIQFRN